MRVLLLVYETVLHEGFAAKYRAAFLKWRRPFTLRLGERIAMQSC